jgi:putative ABC transport system ATP-binding protein
MRNGTTSETTPGKTGTTAAMLDLRDVRLTLESGAGEVNILRGVDLVVPRGQTVAVLGPSGSGKSSLLMVAAGIERASAGRIAIAGTDISQLDEDGRAAFRQRHIGVVFQAFHLVPAMTALENVMVPMEIAGARDAHKRARAALASVGLDHRLHHYPTQLSGGEQQRVALARAFATEPELVLADEPTGNLDGETGHAVADLLFGMSRDRGTTLLLVTHDPELATRCGRILNMHDGKLVEADEQ